MKISVSLVLRWVGAESEESVLEGEEPPWDIVPRGEEVYVRSWEVEEGRWCSRGCEERGRACRELKVANLLIFDVFERWRRQPRMLSIAPRSILAGFAGIAMLSIQDLSSPSVSCSSVYDFVRCLRLTVSSKHSASTWCAIDSTKGARCVTKTFRVQHRH